MTLGLQQGSRALALGLRRSFARYLSTGAATGAALPPLEPEERQPDLRHGGSRTGASSHFNKGESFSLPYSLTRAAEVLRETRS